MSDDAHLNLNGTSREFLERFYKMEVRQSQILEVLDEVSESLETVVDAIVDVKIADSIGTGRLNEHDRLFKIIGAGITLIFGAIITIGMKMLG